MSSEKHSEIAHFAQRLTLLGASKLGRKEPLSKYWNPVLDRYRPKAIIGKGQFGQVIRAKHKLSNEVVAIKQIKAAGSHEHLQKIIREIALLKHFSKASSGFSGATRLVEAFSATIEGQLLVFIVMEYVPLTLSDVLDNSVDLGLQEEHVAIIFENLSRAVQWIHSAGVMHRDLKPANILVKDDLSVKLCDFGYSRCVVPPRTNLRNTPSSDSSKRRLSMHVQTRYYRAPEVILLEHSYDQAVDLWSLGCILAEMLVCLPEYRSSEEKLPRVVFAGRSCFPLSPASAESDGQVKVASSDQLRSILKVLGRIPEDDCSHIVTNKAYLTRLMSNQAPVDFSEEFSETSSKLVQQLTNLLQFNPRRRNLDVAIPEMAPLMILDLDSQGAFDYTTKEYKNWTTSELEALLLQQLAH